MSLTSGYPLQLLHPLIALKTLVSRADRGPFVYPTEDVDNSPPDDDFPFDAPIFHVSRKTTKCSWRSWPTDPESRREDLLTLTGKISGVLTRHMGRLKRRGRLVEQKGPRGRLRYMLSQEGVDYMARRDRAHLGLARDRPGVGSCPRTIRAPSCPEATSYRPLDESPKAQTACTGSSAASLPMSGITRTTPSNTCFRRTGRTCTWNPEYPSGPTRRRAYSTGERPTSSSIWNTSDVRGIRAV